MAKCPKCGGSQLFYTTKTDSYECLTCKHVFPRVAEKTVIYGVRSGVKPLWPNMEAEATVEREEIPTFSPAMLDLVKKAWQTKQPQNFWEWLIYPSQYGVLVGLRGTSRPHEFFSETIIKEMEFKPETKKYEAPEAKAVGTTFYFENRGDRDRAREFLTRHNFYFPDGPDFSLTDIDDPDYMLELLDSEGFDTSKISVER